MEAVRLVPMRRRTLLAAGTGTIAGLGGCVGGLPRNPPSDGRDDSGPEIAENSGITGVDVLTAPPIVSSTYEEPLALLVTDEVGGERAVAEEPAFGTIVDETDFSRSVLLHAITWGTNGCYEIEAREVEVVDGSVHLTVRRYEDEERAERGCNEGMPTISLVARIAFADEPPESGLCTFFGQAAELEAIDIEDWDPCTYRSDVSNGCDRR